MTSLNEQVWGNRDQEKERQIIEGVLEHLAHSWKRHPRERLALNKAVKDFLYLVCPDKDIREHYFVGYKIIRRR